jgi:hypothetical protein
MPDSIELLEESVERINRAMDNLDGFFTGVETAVLEEESELYSSSLLDLITVRGKLEFIIQEKKAEEEGGKVKDIFK